MTVRKYKNDTGCEAVRRMIQSYKTNETES